MTAQPANSFVSQARSRVSSTTSLTYQDTIEQRLLTGRVSQGEHKKLITNEALEFLAVLHRNFEPTRKQASFLHSPADVFPYACSSFSNAELSNRPSSMVAPYPTFSLRLGLSARMIPGPVPLLVLDFRTDASRLLGPSIERWYVPERLRCGAVRELTALALAGHQCPERGVRNIYG